MNAAAGRALAAQPAPLTLAPAAITVQRACACKTTGTRIAECDECRGDRGDRSRDGGVANAPALADVGTVVGTPGAALDGATRAFMEPGFAQDFSRVRVHVDPAAAASARSCAAAAYTVGSHIVFGAGRYAPATRDGRRLIAHELAHVVQQTGGGERVGLQRASIGVSPRAQDLAQEDEGLEHEAEQAAATVLDGGLARLAPTGVARLQRQRLGSHPAIEGLDEAGPHADLTGGTEDSLFACTRGAGPNPPDCAPPRSLTWANFTGAPRRSTFGAETASDVRDLPMDPAFAGCVQRILGWTAGQSRVFQGFFVPARSWVKAQFSDPTNIRVNGCQRNVTACQRFFAVPANRSGGTFSLSTTPDRGCPAGAVPAASTATNRGECTTVLAPGCAAAAVAESTRLLNHEQRHFDLSCAIARHANGILALGRRPLTIAEVQSALRTTQRAYDDETNHGCLRGPQASWEQQIDGGLPAVEFPVIAARPRPPARRPRRR